MFTSLQTGAFLIVRPAMEELRREVEKMKTDMASVVRRQNEEFAKAVDELRASDAVTRAEAQSDLQSIIGHAKSEFEVIRQEIRTLHDQTSITFRAVEKKLEEIEKNKTHR